MTDQRSTVVIDLDGVVWLAGEGLPGAAEAVEALRLRDFAVLFVTNNSSPTLDEYLGRFSAAGIETHSDEIITAAHAAVHMTAHGSTAHLVGEAGLREAAAQHGIIETKDSPDTVIVGWSHDFDFETISVAASAIRSGARFIATNDDPTHPTPQGLLPGTGSLVAAIATAAEAQPIVAGKPGEGALSLIRERSNDVTLVVGDRPSTDGVLAERLGVPFALVQSAATPAEQSEASYQGESLMSVVQAFLADRPR